MFKKLKALLLNSYNFLLNLIFNKKCLICGCLKTDKFLCKTCSKDIQFLSGFAHKIYNNIPFYSACLYENNIKTLIQHLKFKHKRNNAKALAEILYHYFIKLNLDNDFIITYPPSHFIKSTQRGYNHMYLIAKEFSNLSNIELSKKLIQKIKPTKPQYSVKNRHLNIKDSFAININELNKIKQKENKTILLIDDLTTTGATLEELINLFLNKNFNNIVCLTICKSSKKQR